MAHWTPDLKAVIDAWPSMPEADRKAVLAIVRRHAAKPAC